MPMHTLADGHSLYYELSGPADADTLVLLNGLTMNTAAWGWHTPLYAGQFQVLTLDLRGQGQSSKPEADAYPLAQQADDVASLLDALGIARAHVLGLSYGGMVAQHLARQHPAKVARLVLASTLAYSDAANAAIAASWEAAQCTGGGDQLFTDMLPWVFGSQFLASQQAMLQAMRALAAQAPWEPVRRLSNGVLAHDARPWLGQLRQPTLVVVGSEDRMTPRYQADALVAGIAGARLEVLPGVGHASHLEALPQFVALTSAFLREA
ncbi:alpha/beta fold hydrolase [Rivihabitans pingtungensis]|uniref:alpha/beta fold hydrolase n=1 Tax=Rivihabitans pingtungensis TaxID=1054498 RepID=UPI0023F24541|nr:alpha/beta hydrolase [Rivihabitans pingtungensis]